MRRAARSGRSRATAPRSRRRSTSRPTPVVAASGTPSTQGCSRCWPRRTCTAHTPGSPCRTSRPGRCTSGSGFPRSGCSARSAPSSGGTSTWSGSSARCERRLLRRPMLIAAQLVAGLAAVLHVVFFVFESLLWTRPEVYARFGIGSREQAETIRPMAFNQGFYNLALAVGLVVGKTLVIFATACMVVAGVVLASTGKKYWRAAAIQLVPAALALVLVLLV